MCLSLFYVVEQALVKAVAQELGKHGDPLESHWENPWPTWVHRDCEECQRLRVNMNHIPNPSIALFLYTFGGACAQEGSGLGRLALFPASYLTVIECV